MDRMCGANDFDLDRLKGDNAIDIVEELVKPKSKRIRLSEMDHWCCSIIGTCLTHDDLLAIARKRDISVDADTRMFDVHGFFVSQAGSANPVSRALEKLLNQRYSGMIRRVGRLKCATELAEFWNTAVSSGQVAGAYWALLSHRHVPEELRSRVFGEVHMMSHLMGGSTRKIVGAAAELQTRLETLERQQKRWSAQVAETMQAKDAEIEQLRTELAAARHETARAREHRAETPMPSADQMSRTLQKKDRALAAARTRARQLESELDAAGRRLERLRAHRTATPLPAGSDAELTRGLCGKAVLYLGGRKDAASVLEREAASANITLHCHDGGLDHSVQQIDDLVHKCDAVICPVNCINHAACLKAKQLCKRLNKPFLPVGSSGRGTFSRALVKLAGEIGAAAPAAS